MATNQVNPGANFEIIVGGTPKFLRDLEQLLGQRYQIVTRALTSNSVPSLTIWKRSTTWSFVVCGVR